MIMKLFKSFKNCLPDIIKNKEFMKGQFESRKRSQQDHQRDDISLFQCIEEVDKKIDNGEHTQFPSPSLQGVWKTNHFLDFDKQKIEMVDIPFRHITSFENGCMENHGKTLTKSFMNFIHSRQNPEAKERQDECENEENEEELQDYLETDLKLKIQNINLVQYVHKKFEAKKLILYIYSHLPKQYLQKAMNLMAFCLREYAERRIQIMQEEDIAPCISQALNKISVRCRFLFEQELGSFADGIQDQNYTQMISAWTQSIFYGLNGIYQKSSLERRVSESEILSETGSFSSRKMKKYY